MASVPSDGEASSVLSDFVSFLNVASTAFHAVEATIQRLTSAGFQRLLETEEWGLRPGGKYFFTRSGTTVVAFSVGGMFKQGGSFTVLGAHTDSPCLKIKPVACVTKADALLLNTQPYGGGLWHTWFDRDLGIAGRVIVRSDENILSSKLVQINDPIARIPNLAIHLTSGAERESFAPNLHEHGKAIISMDPSAISFFVEGVDKNTERLHPFLAHKLAQKLSIPINSIVDAELQLIDLQPSVVGGGNGELLFSGRLDNLCSAYQSLRALIDSTLGDISTQDNIRLVMMFDHEEVGSSSCSGAGSSLFMDTLRRITLALDGHQSHDSLLRSLRRSLVVSADMAHAQHPNYASKHDSSMAPKINAGVVIKHNANQRYATNAISATLFREACRRAGAPVQEFTVRADSGCGSTIGPIIATLSGILTVDVGTPQLSMHSIREMMGSHDVYNGYKAFKAVLDHHTSVPTSGLLDR